MTLQGPPLTRRRSPSALTIGLLLAISAIAGGCGDTQPTTADRTANDSLTSNARSADRSHVEILAAQGAPEATMRRSGSDETYELTMEHPKPTLYFADSPSREVQTAPVRDFPSWVRRGRARQGYAPNVTLSWDETGGPQSVVAELRDVTYEKSADRLRATLDLLASTTHAPASAPSGRLGAEPFTNSPATMVVDGLFESKNRCWSTVVVPPYSEWTRQRSSIEGAWLRSPPETIASKETPIGSETDEWLHGCEFLVRYTDEEGNGFEVGVDNPASGSASNTCNGFGRAVCEVYDWVERPTESGYEALLQAQVYYKEE